MTARRIEDNQTANHEIQEGVIEPDLTQRSDRALSNLADLSGDLPQPLYFKNFNCLPSLPDFVGHDPFETLYQRITQSKTSSPNYE